MTTFRPLTATRSLALTDGPVDSAGRWRCTVIVTGIAILAFVLYAMLSVQRHHQMLTTGFDLGIFEQEVRSYAAGQLPTSLLKGPDYPLLGDHFSPIVALIAPIYALFPMAETLLLTQAALMAVGVIPLVRWALARQGWAAAATVAGGYVLSWGVVQAINFDFHEIAFAVPLLAFSLAALGQDRPRAAVLWALPLVLVKEDLGLTVAMIGLLVVVRGGAPSLHLNRIQLWGLGAGIVGVASSAVEMLVIIPSFNPSGANAYTGQFAPGGVFAQLAGVLSPDTKIITLVMMLAPTAFLALRSPLVLVALPTLLWRFLSDNPYYWGQGFHYSAVLMPIVFAAFIDGLGRLRGPRSGWLAGSALVTLLLLAGSPLLTLSQPSFWNPSARIVAARAVIEKIPDGATVAASNTLAPQLTATRQVSQLNTGTVASELPEYIVADTQGSPFPFSSIDEQHLVLQSAETKGYDTLVDTDGFTLLHLRNTPL